MCREPCMQDNYIKRMTTMAKPVNKEKKTLQYYTAQIMNSSMERVRKVLEAADSDPYRNVLANILLLAIKDSFARNYHARVSRPYTCVKICYSKDMKARRWLTGSEQARKYIELLGLDYESVREKLKQQWEVFDANNNDLPESWLVRGN